MVPEIIVMACCSIGGRLVAGDGRFVTEYWMELWIRNAIPPPFPPDSRSSLTRLWLGVLNLLRLYNLVS